MEHPDEPSLGISGPRGEPEAFVGRARRASVMRWLATARDPRL